MFVCFFSVRYSLCFVLYFLLLFRNLPIKSCLLNDPLCVKVDIKQLRIFNVLKSHYSCRENGFYNDRELHEMIVIHSLPQCEYHNANLVTKLF